MDFILKFNNLSKNIYILIGYIRYFCGNVYKFYTIVRMAKIYTCKFWPPAAEHILGTAWQPFSIGRFNSFFGIEAANPTIF